MTAAGAGRVSLHDRGAGNAGLRETLDQIRSGLFSRGDASVFAPLVDALLARDPYFVLDDYDSYVACQDAVSAAYHDATRWTRMSIVNVARTGRFSSDRAIRDYCRHVWHAVPVPVQLPPR